MSTVRIPTRARVSPWNAGGKLCFDVMAATVLIMVLLPLFVLVAAAVRLTSRGPILFRQPRVGAGGRQFTMLKFRTMTHCCDEAIHRTYVRNLLAGHAAAVDGLYKLDRDPRVTKVGSLLRRSSLDELPQLINVVRGEMSLVGPRPAIVWEVDLFPNWAQCRFEVRPGLTGLWQVRGRNRLTMSEGLALDAEYVGRRGLWLDLKILLLTIPAVLRGGTR